MLIFSDLACIPCGALLPDIRRWQRDYADGLTLALLSRGTAEANHAKLDQHRLANVLLQHHTEVADAYKIRGTPSAVLVRPDGTIGSLAAQGNVEITKLVRQSAQQQPLSASPRVELAPDFTLEDLDGESITLAQFSGRPTLILFWNPGCGFCQRMLEDLKAWESRPSTERAQLLVVSRGTEDDNRAMGLQSTIALDQDFSVAARYGVKGTPAAVLVDAEGSLVSEAAVGAPAVLALAGQPESPPEALADRPLATLPPGTKPLKRDCVTDELLSDASMVLYHGSRNQLLTLNPTAALVWECCDGDHDAEGIAREVLEVLPSASDAERDVQQTLDELLQADMIQLARAVDMSPTNGSIVAN